MVNCTSWMPFVAFAPLANTRNFTGYVAGYIAFGLAHDHDNAGAFGSMSGFTNTFTVAVRTFCWKSSTAMEMVFSTFSVPSTLGTLMVFDQTLPFATSAYGTPSIVAMACLTA